MSHACIPCLPNGRWGWAWTTASPACLLCVQVLADLRAVLQVLEEPALKLGWSGKPLRLLLELLDGHSTVSPSSFPLGLQALLRAFTTEREGKLIMENATFRETLQVCTLFAMHSTLLCC